MSTRIADIVLASDFSAAAHNALRRAGRLAQLHGARLRIVHSIAAAGWIDDAVGAAPIPDPARLNAAIEQALERERALLPAELLARTGTATLEGPLHRSLPAWLDAHPVDLVAVGAYGESNWRQVLLGSTAERLLLRSRTPLLLTRIDAATDYRKAILATDFSAAAERAAAFGAALANTAHKFLVHADERLLEPHLAFVGVQTDIVEEYRRERVLAALRRLEASAGRLPGGASSVVPVLREAPPARALTELVDEIGADLVVVGASGRDQLVREFLGSVSHHLATTLPCDVLVVP